MCELPVSADSCSVCFLTWMLLWLLILFTVVAVDIILLHYHRHLHQLVAWQNCNSIRITPRLIHNQGSCARVSCHLGVTSRVFWGRILGPLLISPNILVTIYVYFICEFLELHLSGILRFLSLLYLIKHIHTLNWFYDLQFYTFKS